MTKHRFCLILIAGIFVTATVSAQQLAPLNPAFTQFIREKHKGIIPSPIRMPSSAKIKTLNIYPTSYDLRTYNRCSAVQNQGSSGDCWAFAAISSAEGNLLPATQVNLSELHLANSSKFDYAIGDGGNIYMATAYMASWDGPVLESDDPFSDIRLTSPSTLPTYRHMQNTIIFPPRDSSTDNDLIKQCLMSYGPITTAVFWDHANYSWQTAAMYCPTSTNSNHEISIVGWDDNFSRTNFTSAGGNPPGDGAFLIKNSWGTSWGQSGFCWISYYDANILTEGACHRALEPITNYQHIYQYDPLGWIQGFGFESPTGYAACIYTAEAAEQIQAVSFYAASTDSSYEVSVCLDPTTSPLTNNVSAITSGITSYAGYVTIPLTQPVSVTAGQKFAVILKITTPDYQFPIPVETAIDGYSSAASASAGETYVSSDGIVWEDATSIDPSLSVCLKAFGRPTTTTCSISGNINLGEDFGKLSYMPTQAQLLNTDGASSRISFPLKRHLNGDYQIDWVPMGVVKLRVKGDHYLASTAIVDTSNGSTSTNFNLTNGDANGDNKVNLFDIVSLDMNFGKSSTTADLNGDGLVNLFDYMIIDIKFGAQGSNDL